MKVSFRVRWSRIATGTQETFSALGMLGNRALLHLDNTRRSQWIFYAPESPRRTIPCFSGVFADRLTTSQIVSNTLIQITFHAFPASESSSRPEPGRLIDFQRCVGKSLGRKTQLFARGVITPVPWEHVAESDEPEAKSST